MPNFYAQYPGSASGSNASVAPFPGPAPAFATLIAGENSGNIVPVSVDSSGDVNVNIVSSGPVSGTVTANQGTPAVIANAWPIEIVGSGNIASVTAANAVVVDGSAVTQPISGTVAVSNFPAAQPVSGTVTADQGGAWSVAVNNFPATQPVSGTVAVSSVAGNVTVVQPSGSSLHVDVDNFPATQPVSGTVAVTQSTSPWVDNLTQVGGSAISLGQAVSAASFPVVIASDQSAVPISAASLPLPTGAATSANQTNASQKTQIVDGSGNVIASTSNALNVDVTNTVTTSAPINTNGSFSQASISVASTITAPANAIGFLLEADSANTDWLRWTDSNSTASASNGMKLEPGRDTGFIPMKHAISICPNTGTQTYTIQWVLSS